MNVLKTAALGVLLASAAWMPSLANGFDEAASVTSDPHVAYTLYIGKPSAESEAAFDSLPDWKKQEHVAANGGGITCIYTRTLKDGTKQRVSFPRSSKFGTYFIIMKFTTPKAEDAHQMYLDAVKRMTQEMGAPESIRKIDVNYLATFREADGYTVYLTYNTKEKTFEVDRHYVYH